MNNKDIAKILTDRITKINNGVNFDEMDFPILCFVEKAIFDETVNGYDRNKLNKAILDFMNKNTVHE